MIIAKPGIFDQSKFESFEANADEQLAPQLHDGIGSRFAFSQIHRLVNEFCLMLANAKRCPTATL